MNHLLKLTMEFEDKIQILEGEEAKKWLEAVNGACIMEAIHGRPIPEFKWIITNKT